MLETFTTRPQPCAFMGLAAARQNSQGPFRLVSRTASQSSSVSDSIGPRMLMPALLTRMSSRPQVSSTFATASSTSPDRTESAPRPRNSPPEWFARSKATASAVFLDRDVIATDAPASARACAATLPNPFDPPVTSAFRPSSRNRSSTPMPHSPGSEAVLEFSSPSLPETWGRSKPLLF